MKRFLCVLLAVLLFFGIAPPAATAAEFTTEPMISAGGDHTVALRSDGTVWAWGNNNHGQLGNGTTRHRHIPAQIHGLSNVIAIAAGLRHSAALRNDGTVWTWGANWSGQLGDGTTTDRHMPVQVQTLSGITAIAVGESYTVALRSDGTVWTWGSNVEGQLGDGTTTDRHTPVRARLLSGVTAIAAGGFHAVALRRDGTVWTWGWGEFAQLGSRVTEERCLPAQVLHISNVTAIAAGRYHTTALREDGIVWAWGDNLGGQLGNGEREGRWFPVQVQNLSDVTAITTFDLHTASLRSDGTVWAWGQNSSGQIDGTTTTVHRFPVQAQNFSDAMAVSAGGGHTVALRSDGAVWAWGENRFGQLGDGTSCHSDRSGRAYNNRHTPIQVLGPGGVGQFNLYDSIFFTLPFSDVSRRHWAHEAASFVYGRDLMQGTSPTTFAPNVPLTRAMAVTILHRMAGTPADMFSSAFDDVTAGRWYANAVTWAARNGIVTGFGDGRFAPSAHITREQFATMLHRYARLMDYDMSKSDFRNRPDSGDISSWAEDAMRWAVHHGFIRGGNFGRLNPSGTASRAECAAILQRFILAFA